MTARRLTKGGHIDRANPIHFMFDGKRYSGFAGDTLASALLANGVTVLGRSFKYHRPRGLLAGGPEEPNALVTIIDGPLREPNVPATMVELRDGLVAESQNRWPSLALDLGAVNQLGGKMLAAGFYYKTFMGPFADTRLWMLFERFIRRAAGLGRASVEAADDARYERMNAFCDVLVVGGGPAGLSAAIAAARRGKRVMIADQEPRFGGILNWSDETVGTLPGHQWAQDQVAELEGLAKVAMLPRTLVWGRYDDNSFAALERVSTHRPAAPGEPRLRHWVIRAQEVVLATGALERPLVFPGNDVPGVMLASAMTRLTLAHAVMPARRIVLVANNDHAYAQAKALHARGMEIAALVDLRPSVSPAVAEIARTIAAEHLPGHCIMAVRGRQTVKAARIAPVSRDGSPETGFSRWITCDGIAMSGGHTPQIQLAAQRGEKPVFDERIQAFVAAGLPEDTIIIGAAAGRFDAAEAIADGMAAGGAPKNAERPVAGSSELSPTPGALLANGGTGKAFVDFQHDVTADDLALAHREGFSAPEHAKRYTTLGMATDQGKSSAMTGLSILAALGGSAPGDLGTTRFRPPVSGVPLAALAAERTAHLFPDRLTPMQDWHETHGAKTYPAGLWHRPMAYFNPGETLDQAYTREAAHVRAHAGVIDVSTLGKILVQGADAGRLLDHVYTNMMSSLPVMKARYGLMLREDGLLFDDGTVWRLAETEFLVTTTTANAGKVMDHLEYCIDCLFPELAVSATSVSDQWAAMAIAGPKARAVLADCVEGARVDNDTLPHMGIVKGRIDDAPVMIARLSFSGERAYEVFTPSGFGQHVWDAVMASGRAHDLQPYGLEALGTLRIEKGHITGAEMNGRATADDLGLGAMLSKKKSFIGSAMVRREGLTRDDRKQLVGFISCDGRLPSGGAHLVASASETGPDRSLGHVTAGCFSPALGKPIGLALVKGGRSLIGTRLDCVDPLRGKTIAVEIVSPHFLDPDGSRMRD